MSCGFPVRGSRCPACGAARGSRGGTNGYLQDILPTAEAEAVIDRAIEALAADDAAGFVGHVLVAMGGATVQMSSTPDGPSWTAWVAGAHVHATLNRAAGELLIEAPVACVPQHQRVPVLRLALELSAWTSAATSRFYLREEELVLRFSAHLAALCPAILCRLLAEMGALAARYADVLEGDFEAAPSIGEAPRPSLSAETTRRARNGVDTTREGARPAESSKNGASADVSPQGHDGGYSSKPPGPGRLPAAPPPRSPVVHDGGYAPKSSAHDGGYAPKPQQEPPRQPGRGETRRVQVAPPPITEAAGNAAADEEPDSIPAILAPRLATNPGIKVSALASAPVAFSPKPASSATSSPNLGSAMGPPASYATAPQINRPAPGRLPAAMAREASTVPDIPVSQRAPMLRPMPSAPPVQDPGAVGGIPAVSNAVPISSAEDRKRAAVTAPNAMRRPVASTAGTAEAGVDTVPAFRLAGAAENPQMLPADRLCLLLRQAEALIASLSTSASATIPWLVRAAVFRAIHDYHEALPDATAHLYRCVGIGRDNGEPPLQVMQRIIGSQAQIAPEKPLAVEPFTTATQAKEQVARYLVEIERAPSDPPIRHYFALGALTELLVRSKLPPQVEQRLRDIVSHAQREGAKSSAIDLMMTALQRIAAG